MTEARALVLGLAAALSGCLIHGPAPYEPPAPTSTSEVRRSWHAGGIKRSEEAILVWSDGRVERHGRSRHWYATGAVGAERAFEHDLETGVWKEWFEDGSLRSEVDMGDGATPAPMRFLHANGRVAAEGQGIRGVREGPWTFWFDSGRISHEGPFEGAIRHGAWTYWSPQGGKLAEGEYSMGERVGTWLLWDADGNETVKEESAARRRSVPR